MTRFVFFIRGLFVCCCFSGFFFIFFIICLFICLLKAGAEKLGERDLSDGLPFYGPSHLPLVQFRSRWLLCPRKSLEKPHSMP